MAVPVRSPIDYSAAVREGLRVFTEQKCRALRLSGHIDLRFSPLEPSSSQKNFEMRVNLANLHRTILINTRTSDYQNLNEVKFDLTRCLGLTKAGESRQRSMTILSWLQMYQYPCALLITTLALAILQISTLPTMVAALCVAGVVDISVLLFRRFLSFSLTRTILLESYRTAAELCSPEERQAGINILTRLREERLAQLNNPNLASEERSRFTPEGDVVGHYAAPILETIRMIQNFA